MLEGLASNITVQGFAGAALRLTQSGLPAASFAPFGLETVQSTKVSTDVQRVMLGNTPRLSWFREHR